MKKIIKTITVVILLAFALLTLFLSSSVIFDWFGVRAKEGNYVLFVVWANFISSFLYLASVYGLITLKRWTYKPLAASVVLLVLTLIGLFIYIHFDGIYETKTIGALIFRATLSSIFTFSAYLSTVKWHQ
jgi:hypothetical protein